MTDMPHEIAFKTIPIEVAHLLNDQLNSALQIIAALVMTDEEVLAARQQEDSTITMRGVQGWAKCMREEMLDADWRPTLVDYVSQQGFLTNTHPGFPLSSLSVTIPSLYRLSEAAKTLEKMLQAYAADEGEDMPDFDDGAAEESFGLTKAYWAKKLVEAGHHERVAASCMEHGGLSLMLSAACTRAFNQGMKAKAATG